MTQLLPVCDGLPVGVTKATAPLGRYERPFSWSNNKHKYTRTASGALWLTAEQHAGFLTMAKFATYASNMTYRWVRTKTDATRAPMEDDDIHAIMRKVDDELLAGGCEPGSLSQVAASRAAAHMLSVCAGYLKEGRLPVPKYPVDRELAWALPVRLARGVLYGSPVVAEVLEGGAWLDLGLPGGDRAWLATLPALPAGRRIDDCSWCEFTFWDRTWRLRFVYGEELTDAERDARKASAAARAKALAAKKKGTRK